MRIKVVWPGKTKDLNIRELQEYYLKHINRLGRCELVETKAAKGIHERYSKKILNFEAEELERYLEDSYIICLFHKGNEMSSEEMAVFMENKSVQVPRTMTFVVGGFLGVADRLLKRADYLLSLSRMTFSHELTRVILLEQIYRSLSIIKGKKFAK